MAETPRTITVRLDVRGTDELVEQVIRKMVRSRHPVPPRRRPWQRWAHRLLVRRR